MLESFVCIVDAKLFERIDQSPALAGLGRCDVRIVLEAVDIQDTNERFSHQGPKPLFPREAVIDNRDEPVKHARVYELGDTVAYASGLSGIERHYDAFGSCRDLLLSHPSPEII